MTDNRIHRRRKQSAPVWHSRISIEPVSRAFAESSAGLADNGMVVMFPAERRELGDVYVKTGTLRGHDVYIVKVSPWFSSNAERGQPQGGFVGVFDSATGRTLALSARRALSVRHPDRRGRSRRRANPRAVRHVDTAAVLGAGVQAYWQPLALYRERPFQTLVDLGAQRGQGRGSSKRASAKSCPTSTSAVRPISNVRFAAPTS